ncbi:MAG: hypothetical protein AAGA95_05565, partial [Pseudomonadota bacterium]
DFSLDADTELPSVDLVFSYSGGTGPAYSPRSLPAGLVITATNMTCTENLVVRDLARRGVPVVNAFPTGESIRRLRDIEDGAPERFRQSCSELAGDPRLEGPWIPPLPAQMLTPQKARILLMLALEAGADREELERIFTAY